MTSIPNPSNALAHPLILKTADGLAWHLVTLGFCRHQDHKDLFQDLMLYLTRKFNTFTGTMPLIDWARRVLYNHVKAITQRFLGVPKSVPASKRTQAAASVVPGSPTPTPNRAPVVPIACQQSQEPIQSQEPSQHQAPSQSAGPISPSHPTTNPAPSQSSAGITAAGRMERSQRAQESGGWRDTPPKPGVGGMRKLLHGFWLKVSCWVQGPPPDRTPEPPSTEAKRSSSAARDAG